MHLASFLYIEQTLRWLDCPPRDLQHLAVLVHRYCFLYFTHSFAHERLACFTGLVSPWVEDLGAFLGPRPLDDVDVAER